MTRVSITCIAADLGVSPMSVSVALRGKPGVSEALRNRILQRAREMGYRPDPVTAELMSLVRSSRRRRGAETIAFLNTFADPGFFHRIEGFVSFVNGAKERAAQFGYRVELFDVRAAGMTSARLARILKARGVRGVLLGPRWLDEPDITFPWSDFSVVLVGEAAYGPNLYRVCNHHLHSCATCLRVAVECGYRRIGVALFRKGEVQRSFDYLLGVDQFVRSGEQRAQIIPWLFESFDSEATARWVRRKRLDCVISLSAQVGLCVTSMPPVRGRRIGFASLSLERGSSWAGIDQHLDQIGAASVDLLRNLLLSGERGVPPQPRIMLVEGEWKEGDTIVRPAATTAVP
jgi:LacI family transcriptional regulator